MTLTAGIAVSAALLAYVLRDADLESTWRHVRMLDVRQFALPAAIAAAIFLVRTTRWFAIFPAEGRPPFRLVFSTIAIGYMLNNYLPGRGGDIARCVLLRKRVAASHEPKRAGASIALATVVVERLFDGMALLVVAVASFLFLSPPDWMRTAGMGTGAVLVLLAALLIAIRYSADRVSAAIARACALVGMERLGGRLAAQLGQFAEGLAIVSSWRQMSCVGAYTVLVWLLEAAGVAMVSRAAGLPLGASAIFTMMAVLGLGMMIPSAPGYVGTYQFLVVAALAMFGVVPSAALAFSLVLHAWLYVTTTLWGVVGLSLGGFSLYDTRRA